MTQMRRPTPAGTAVVLAVLAAAAYLAWAESRGPTGESVRSVASAPPAAAARTPPSASTPPPSSRPAAGRPAASPGVPAGNALVMRDQRIVDERGRVIYEGDVDLGPVFTRMAAGTRDPHRNDGATFANREGRLPRQPRGSYTEWVVRTPGTRGVGPQRVVTGRNGDAYYTPDHYETFVRVRPPS